MPTSPPSQLPVLTVAQVHALTSQLMAEGLATLPVCATNGRARYPVQFITSVPLDGCAQALLVLPRADARFAIPTDFTHAVSAEEVNLWNEFAEEATGQAVPPLRSNRRIQERPEPTSEQLEALRRFAAKHGRNWRTKLSQAWASGKDERLPDAALLRQVRNQLGPKWLKRFKLLPS